jgi:hypothetical protein
MFYITIATKPHDVLTHLQKKVQLNNENITILGQQENRFIGWNSQGNFGVKIQEVFNYLQRSELSDDDIILFSDAYDVVYYGTFTEILEKYKMFNSPIVFGCETDCSPDLSLAKYYTDTTMQFPYLNSGLFIGRVKELRHCMKGYEYNDKHDDQIFWMHKFFQNPDKIKLDYDNKLFLNTHGIDENDLIYKNNRVYYHDKEPTFVHVNGANKGLVNILIKN